MVSATINQEMIAARPYLTTFSPGPGKLFNGNAAKVAKVAFGALAVRKHYKAWRNGRKVSEMTGEVIGSKIISKATRPVSVKVERAHLYVPHIQRDLFRKNGMGGRSWYDQPGRHEMVIIFHDANRAGPHIDVHIGRLSVIYKVKPELYAQLKYNNQGMLTEDSRKLIMDHVRAEIANGSRVPQNLDHSLSNARAQWTNGDPEGRNYGDGRTRQIVDISTVDIYKAHRDGPIEMYAPHLNPHRSMYLYRLYPGDDKRAPILIWGNKGTQPPKLEDRLHLKMVDPIILDADELPAHLDWSTSTAKYDGSSAYIVIDKKGTTVWSPRQAKATGEQIEYTHKLNGIASVTSDETIVAMGEVLFKPKPTLTQKLLRQEPDYLPCAQGSGILNSNKVLPRDVEPEIRLYRVDRVGRVKMGDQDFWSNREVQQQVAALSPDHLKVVELMSPDDAADLGFEGVVVAQQKVYGEAIVDGEPEPWPIVGASSVNDAVKIKYTMDPHDWRIDEVHFHEGPRGGVAGVVKVTSLESGKKFKLGPGQMGDHELCRDMAEHPEDYVGSVVKVSSRRGHEGRAAKVIGFHDDKGVAVA